MQRTPHLNTQTNPLLYNSNLDSWETPCWLAVASTTEPMKCNPLAISLLKHILHFTIQILTPRGLHVGWLLLVLHRTNETRLTHHLTTQTHTPLYNSNLDS